MRVRVRGEGTGVRIRGRVRWGLVEGEGNLSECIFLKSSAVLSSSI